MVVKTNRTFESPDSRGGSLSAASPYEQAFKTRQRRVGRPQGDVEPLFGTLLNGRAVHPVIALVAKRRAYAVIAEEQRRRLAEVFDRELKVLSRRGVEVVAKDAGVKLKTEGEDHG